MDNDHGERNEGATNETLEMVCKVYKAISEKWQTRGPSKATKETVMEQLLVIRRNLEQNTTPATPAPALLPSAIASTPSNLDTNTAELQQQVNKIQQDLAEIKAAFIGKKAPNNTSTTTWSNIAMTAPAQIDRKTTTNMIAQIQKQEQWKENEKLAAQYVVTLTASENRETQLQIQSMHHKEITERLQRAVKQHCLNINRQIPPLIPGIQSLSNGNIRILAVTREEARVLREIDWRATFKDLQLHQPKHGMVIHAISKSDLNIEDEKASRQHLEELNPGIDILKIAPLYRKQHAGLDQQSIIVFTDTKDSVTKSIQYGMHINYRRYTTVQEYLPQYQLTQCYNCHQYGHRAASCKNTPQCGQCKSTDHKADKCNIEPTQFKCCNCDGNHEAWNKDCPSRIAERQKLCELRKVL